jgi:hypothetical protein
VNVGRPWGSGPNTDKLALSAKPNSPTIALAPKTAINIPGMRGIVLSARMAANVPAPTANAIQLAFPFKIACAIAHRFRNGPSPSIEKPKILGSWLTRTVSAIPFM